MLFKFLLVFSILIILLAACSPISAGSPKNDATLAAVSATKFVEATQTATLMSTETPEEEESYILDQIKMFDEKNGWLVAGREDGPMYLFHTTDGGLSWADVTPPGISDITPGFFFLDAQTAWLPSSTPDTNVPTIFHTSDAGKSWEQYGHLPFKQAVLHFTNPSFGWATADGGSNMNHDYFTLYQSLDGGIHWTQLLFAKNLGLASDAPTLPVGTFQVANGQNFYFLDPSTIWFGGNQLEAQDHVILQLSRDAGQTWSQKTIEVPGTDQLADKTVIFGTPLFLSEKDGYIVASYSVPEHDGLSAQAVSDVMMTHDGGNTWIASPNLVKGESYSSLHIDFISSTDAFFHCGDSLCRTLDGAQTWTSIRSNFDFTPINDHYPLLDLDFVNAQVGWAIIHQDSQYQLIKTNDGGVTWTMLHP